MDKKSQKKFKKIAKKNKFPIDKSSFFLYDNDSHYQLV